MTIFNKNINRVFSLIKSKLLFLLLFTIVGTTAVGLYTVFIISPIYSVSSKLIMKNTSSQTNGQNNDAQTIEAINLFQRQAKTYLEIADLPPVKDETNKALGLSPDDIAKIKSVKLTNDSGSQLVTITVRGLDRNLAERYIKEYVSQYKKFTADRLGRDNLSVVTEALGSDSPVYPVLWKNLLVSILVFSFVGFNVIFIKYVLSDSIDSYEDLEELVGTPVLGMIPTIERKRRGE
ncbi:YveK family protein [Streptococcus mitis]|uniref:Capsular polysaccharide type 8 biosynthesis protein cap8A n=2 Tax=Streptococcus mitis TaxID=28037 RepID=A0A1X1JMD7_STRMT|nr:chain-length determining protein [Streptococcus mitis]RKV81672.1 MAG: chain-length determining protein [Streptococcus sp.]MDU1467497.1 chain-length determining protein [Streptococcus mitis]MDU2237978.1 chain-length determining protein [Streptococcus mitis]MQQ67157.1 chain-length determining protein [Streptococcus mitis]ORO88376.1 chain-length determining protein [Streptococcus mitis]